MREVEVLVELFTGVEQAKEILGKFDFKGSQKTKDIYYVDPLRKNLQINQDNKLMECCRLREKGDRAYITYKKDHYEKGVWVFSDEYETEIKDICVMENIFDCLGLKRLVVVDNIKHVFETPAYEIVLEEVADLGNFLEVEALHDDGERKVEEIKVEIYKFIEALGLTVGQELNSGKPELLLQKKSLL